MDLYLGILYKLIVGFVLIVIVFRLMGRKEFAQLTPIDMLFVMMMAELFGGVAHTKDMDVVHLIFVIAVWSGLVWIAERLSMNPKMEKVMQGEPSILIRNGVIDKNVMEREHLTEDEILTQLRHQGFFSINEVGIGVLEISGKITASKRGI